jgi:hypothetical protein
MSEVVQVIKTTLSASALDGVCAWSRSGPSEAGRSYRVGFGDFGGARWLVDHAAFG